MSQAKKEVVDMLERIKSLPEIQYGLIPFEIGARKIIAEKIGVDESDKNFRSACGLYFKRNSKYLEAIICNDKRYDLVSKTFKSDITFEEKVKACTDFLYLKQETKKNSLGEKRYNELIKQIIIIERKQNELKKATRN